MIKSFIKLFFMGVFGVFFLSGCEYADQLQQQAAAEENSQMENSSIALSKATPEEVAEHRVECSSKKQDKICVAICFRPPGNPDNEHSKKLPLQALAAHLERVGGPDFADRSTLGYCEDGDDEDVEEMDEDDMDGDEEADHEDDDEDDEDDEGDDDDEDCNDGDHEGDQADDSGDQEEDDDHEEGGEEGDGEETADEPMTCLEDIQACMDYLSF